MTVRVDVFARGHGDNAVAEREKVSVWERELFANDKCLFDAFVWEDKVGLGLDVRAYLGDELVGSTHIFPRLTRRDDTSVLAGCLGGVMTAKGHQGAGIGSTTVRAAGEAIFRNFRADLGILLCMTPLIPFYASLGWRQVQCPVMIEQPAGKVPWPHGTMVLLKDADDALPRSLDLCGLPF